jgi:hypothetical protein
LVSDFVCASAIPQTSKEMSKVFIANSPTS